MNTRSQAVSVLFIVALGVVTSATAQTQAPLPKVQGWYEYCYPSDSSCVADLDQIASAGFNLVINYEVLYNSTLAQVQAYASHANSLGVKIAWDFSDAAWYTSSNPASVSYFQSFFSGCTTCSTVNGAVDYYVQQVESLPATWGYYIGDETAPSYASIVNSYSKEIRAQDTNPSHPRLFVYEGDLSTSQYIVPFISELDMIGDDFYPIGGSGTTIGQMGTYAGDMQAIATQYGIQSADVNQGMSWANNGGSKSAEFPTYQQMLDMRNTMLQNSQPAVMLWYSIFDINPYSNAVTNWDNATDAAFADFALSATPAAATVTAGSYTSYSVAVAAVDNFGGTMAVDSYTYSDFTGPVALTVSGLPSGATASLNPSTVTVSTSEATSTLTVTTASSTPSGSYSLMITGTNSVSGDSYSSFSHAATATLTVNASSSPSFTLSTTPSSLTITQGSDGTSTITVTPAGGFSGSVTLAASGLPSGVIAAFSTNPTTSTSTLTLTASSSATTGTATVTITGTSGSLTAKTTIALAVNAPTAIKFVQVNSNDNTALPPASVSSVAVAYTSAQVAGDLNIVVVGWNDTSAKVSSATDSSGNTYALAVGPTTSSGGPFTQSIYYASKINAASAGANTVTVKFNKGASYPDVRIAEYGGVSALDAKAGASGNSTNSASGAATTAYVNELVFGANIVATGTSGAGSGYTSRLITYDGDIVEDRIVSATGTYNATAPLTSSAAWVMQMATFH
jgi:hypothetical protein